MKQYKIKVIKFHKAVFGRILHLKKDYIQFFAEKYSEMTESEKKLSDHIINNIDRVLTESVHALAAEVNISVATVVRFAQHMGFDGYKEFRLYLAQIGSDQEDFILDFSKNENSTETQINRLLSSCAECIGMTQKNLDYTALSSVAQSIRNSGKIAFFGVGTSYVVCQDANMKFKRVGISAECACESVSASAILLNMKPGDVVIGISHSGNNEFVASVLNTAKKMDLTTVAVTTFKNSKVCEFADHILYSQTRESPMHKAAITSRVGQFAIMDSLFMSYITTYYDDCKSSIEKIYEISESLKTD
jgi:DNA-binding MurR/RpiR family transcriptional regulator